MHDLKILHTSDLLAGAPGSRRVFEEVIEDLARSDLRESVDYIVISGNVTADGSPASFEEAHEILGRITNTLLRRDPGLRLNRLLIVPGPRDTGDGRDFAAFTDFHDRFFAAEMGETPRRVEPFDPNEVIVRDLKDLTLLGLTYWRSARTSAEAVNAALTRAKKRVAGLAYTERTPTILVSSGNLLLDPDDPTSFEAIRSHFRLFFKTTVHCFGAGEGMFSLPTPLTLHHVGIGTGARTEHGYWPVLLNVLTVSPQAMRDPTRQLLAAESWMRRSEGANLVPTDWLKGQLDHFFVRQTETGVSDEVLYTPLLSDLQEKFAKYPFIVLDGFPGAGKGAFFEFLNRRRTLLTIPIHVIPMRVKNQSHYETLGASVLAAVADAGTPPRGATRLLVIHDTCFGKLPKEKKNELKNVLKDGFVGLNQKASEQFDWVLWLRTASDFTLGLDPALDGTKAVTFGPADSEVMSQLVSEYSWVAPVQDRQVRHATGDYTGFSHLILNTASRKFDKYSGAEPMKSDSSLRLLRAVLDADQVSDELDLHRTTIEDMYVGIDICRYIQEKVDACPALDPAQTEVLIDLAEITASLPDPQKKQSVGGVLRRLATWGILAKEGTEAAPRYRVRVLAPFLIRGRKESSMNEGAHGRREAWPTITDEDVTGPIDIVIMTALPEEREAVLSKLKNKRRLNPHPDDIQIGYYSKVPCTFPGGESGLYRVIVTDLLSMGQVPAAIAASNALRRWKAKIIMLVGIAGGLARNGVSLGDVLVADQIAYYGLQSIKNGKAQIRWNGATCDPRLRNAANHFSIETINSDVGVERPGGEGVPRAHVGPIASGDWVIKDDAVLALLAEPYPKLVGVEMEAWGVASAVAQEATPRRFFMVRGVSDLADPNKDSAGVQSWRSYACHVAAKYAIALLQSGPLPIATDQEQKP